MTMLTIPTELESTASIVSSEPFHDEPRKLSWRIVARTIEEVIKQRDVIERSVSSDGYAIFTAPKPCALRPLAGWFEITGVTYDLL